MRPFFRLGALLFAIAGLMAVSGASALAISSPTHNSSARDSASGCQAAVTIDAYDSLTWNPTVLGNLCKTVTFTVTNTGTTVHSFTVSNQVNSTDPSTTDYSWFSWPNLYYDQQLNASGSAGGTLTATITFGGQGAYEFTCKPHYAVGMHGMFYVLEAAPTPPPPPPLFEPFWYIVIAVTGLAVLTVVLGMVYGKQGAHSDLLPRGTPITSRPEYYNDSRPEPLESAEPTARGGAAH
ncbi:MAG: hypothetical protein KGJ23_04230 [Euryarchaeota archaeon]|nr:hypothetical protein [Euryarchaeota archaeon]MDE1835807.1 hypothetical protein [Euryarchaeota archaeon]MDE1880719.1 hypothetical protein [Euryarchaeota archaeon]MDE2043998.1 hypothetical protein [Thermoplasmata archaeon]